MSPHFVHGRDFAFVQAKTRQRPFHVSDRDSTYELLGKNENQKVPPSTLDSGFHITELNSLFQSTREQAWPEQCDGGDSMVVGKGILVDFSSAVGRAATTGSLARTSTCIGKRPKTISAEMR